LHSAITAGNLEVVGQLLDAGASPTVSWDQNEYQPLHIAAMNNHLPMMSLLLDRGAPINSHFGSDGGYESALHYACANGKLEMAELLLDRGAALEDAGHFGTPLGFAVRCGRVEVAEFLLARGADATV
ncbi:ankyrin repeat protein, partial [Mycena filopes]